MAGSANISFRVGAGDKIGLHWIQSLQSRCSTSDVGQLRQLQLYRGFPIAARRRNCEYPCSSALRGCVRVYPPAAYSVRLHPPPPPSPPPFPANPVIGLHLSGSSPVKVFHSATPYSADDTKQPPPLQSTATHPPAVALPPSPDGSRQIGVHFGAGHCYEERAAGRQWRKRERPGCGGRGKRRGQVGSGQKATMFAVGGVLLLWFRKEGWGKGGALD